MRTFLTFFLMSFSISSGIVLGIGLGATIRQMLSDAAWRWRTRKQTYEGPFLFPKNAGECVRPIKKGKRK